MSSPKIAVIIGAGPAGLTAAYELLKTTDIKPLVIEQSTYMGGISRTVNYKGNRMDIGGHRFFSKSDRVMKWWLNMLPLEGTGDQAFQLKYQGQSRFIGTDGKGPDPEKEDRVMLVRNRVSRIYWRRRLFDYPLKMSADTISNMGLYRVFKAGMSYAKSCVLPVKPETNLEHFFINRFGRELYNTFFKSYTEKVWGVPCTEIAADWGAQRIKGLSITKTIKHALSRKKSNGGIGQKNVETSLIEAFMYPKLGPGQMWDVTADEVRAMGGEIRTEHRVEGLKMEGRKIVAVLVRDLQSQQTTWIEADYVFSSMPVNLLCRALGNDVPAQVNEIANALPFRDFFTVGLLVDKLKLVDRKTGGPVKDNWIYIQEPDVLIGRLQLFHNWTKYLVADPTKAWLGLEYFCYDTDAIWAKPDAELVNLGKMELDKIGIIDAKDVVDGCVIRMKKTYPAYFGSYDRFGQVRDYLSTVENLFCVGRNGQHRYNNQDHSMLTAMAAVENIAAGITDKSNVWNVNVEQEYHEEKKK